MPALLLVVPATAAVSASARIVQAVEECRLEPGWPAPSGSKWLSRINRDHHRCWFLSSRAIGGHHTHRVAPPLLETAISPVTNTKDTIAI